MWAVEVYFKDFLEAQPLLYARLHANEVKTSKPNSASDNFILLHRYWAALAEDKREEFIASKKNFLDMLRSIFIPATEAEAHWMPLLKHPQWRLKISQLISHPWGRKEFRIGNITRAISSHHPRIFFRTYRCC